MLFEEVDLSIAALFGPTVVIIKLEFNSEAILIDTSHGCNWDVSSVVVYRANDVSALTPPDILTKDLLITGLCLPPPREPAEVINSLTHVPVATHGQTS